MSLPKRYLRTKLVQPLSTPDGGVLRTIEHACRYMSSLTKQREMSQAWQNACRLILNRAPAHEVTRQLKVALFDGKLDVRAAAPRVTAVRRGCNT